MNNFDLKKFLVENKLTYNSKLNEERGPIIDVNDDQEVEPFEGKQVHTYFIYDPDFYDWLEANYELDFQEGDSDEGYHGDIDITYEDLLDIMEYNDEVVYDNGEIQMD